MRDLPPSGNAVNLPYLTIAHVRDGKITRLWIAADKLDYLQQIGALPQR